MNIFIFNFYFIYLQPTGAYVFYYIIYTVLQCDLPTLRPHCREHGGIKMEQPMGVNFIYAAGGDPLCTLHR